MKILSSIAGFFSKNPFLTVLLLLILFIVVTVSQRQIIRKLKDESRAKEEQLHIEQQRTANNQKALQDTIKYLRDDSIYSKRIIAARQGEIEQLDQELTKALNNVKVVTNTKIKEVPKLVYITDINANVTTNDVQTKVELQDSVFGVGIDMKNAILSVSTRTWFTLGADTANKKVNLNLANEYGAGKPSRLDYTLNFRLQIAQTEANDGSKRVYIKPTDLNGNAIDPVLLGISNVKGVDFIDVPYQPKEPKKKKPTFVVGFGPQAGVTYLNGKVQPYVGVGVGVGLNLLK